MSSDTVIAVLSDMHSGGSTALFPNKFWQFKHTNHTPTPQDKKIFAHFDKCAASVAKQRKGKRLIIVHDGDAIEGYHHNTLQVHTANKAEQAELHIELMDHFMKRVGYTKGDALYYINGTETHTGEVEQEIARDLGAKKNPEGGHVFDHLELKINGRTLWFAHHGKGRGAGAGEGNPLINMMRNVYYDNLKRGLPSPDVIVTGHTHTPAYSVFVVREGGKFRTMRSIIAPSWQRKTRYGYKAAPIEVNEIGAVSIQIGSDGRVWEPDFELMNTGITATGAESV